MAPPFSGVFPIAPTPFTETGALDLDGQRRVLDCMVDQGVDGICILANYSEQFLLADDERDQLLALCLAQVAGRVPVIVTCSHFSTQLAAARARRAAEAGAAMVMLMPPYHGTGLRADETGMLQHFARVADAARLPLMIQDAPLSGVTLSVPFLARLVREVPGLRYAKIETPGTAAKLRGLIEAAGDALEGAVRRRGIDHLDGRSRRRGDRHDAERAAARSDQAGPGAASRRPAIGRGGRLCAASCR